MARSINRLSARTVSTITKPGLHADGGGLYLRVDHSGAKRWAFIYHWNKKRCELGFGPAHTVSLAEAREKALQARKQVANGENPKIKKRRQRVLFGEFADALIEQLSPQWRNKKHGNQWVRTAKVEALNLRPLYLDEIATQHIKEMLLPMWSTKPETAARARGRVERILGAAKTEGFRDGENPARWKGHLDHILPTRHRLTRGHHAAIPYPQIPEFMSRLRATDTISSRALEFTILTAARTGETIGAHKSEFNLSDALWTIPGSRMKEGKDHRVPLTPRAVQIVKALSPSKQGLIFPLSNMAMYESLKEMGFSAYTVHGFRSAFKDWAKETTDFPNWLSEAALSHAVGDKTEQAYSRGEALSKRRKLMDAWAAFCMSGEKKHKPVNRRAG